MSFQIYQNASTEVWSAINPPGQHASGSLLHLPLFGLLFPPQGCGLEAAHHCSHALAEKREGAEYVPKMQNQCSSYVLFQDLQKPPQDEWGKTRDTTEATSVLEENLRWALHSARADLHLYDSWRTAS
ncbi:ferritin light chain-like [Neomonachus schauinslandi]|uniref:Ferritin light chain-like n=1 Tax=Neomonachus schauinslandi TaxID=29088 RepID=A0A8M1MFK4_NEOSC|nr:ferritin light chain-like [Neomonachus schauinslandi]